MPTLKETYRQRAVPALREKLGLSNAMQVPRLTKVVINMGIGVVDKDTLKAHVNELTALAGQKPLITKSRKSISNFKLREGMNIGAKVTLRGARMFDFLERLIQAALPRIRDFRGVSPRGFDGRGNYTLGLKEQTLFPEVDPNAVTAPQGMDITIVTTAKTDDQARELLRQLGMPFAAK